MYMITRAGTRIISDILMFLVFIGYANAGLNQWLGGEAVGETVGGLFSEFCPPDVRTNSRE